MRPKKKKHGNGTLADNSVRNGNLSDSTFSRKSSVQSNANEVNNNNNTTQISQQRNHFKDLKMISDMSKWPPFCREGEAFPVLTPWVAMFVTLAVRVLYVIDPGSWWVLHPDEVFQSMEVAHSQVYGYGFRPYEFIAPSKGDNLSHYQQREIMLGMNALRSPVVPGVYAMVASLTTWTGLQGNPFVMWRVMHVVITSTLPLAVYLYVKATGKPHDVASVASILTAASSHLNIFGTHTVINSFISPFLFISLARAFHVLKIAALRNENETLKDAQISQEDSRRIETNSSSSFSDSKKKKKKIVRLITPDTESFSDKDGEINVLFVDLLKNKSDSYTSAVERQQSFSKDSGKGESLRSGSESGGQSFDDEEDNKDEGYGDDNIDGGLNDNDKDRVRRRVDNGSVERDDVFYNTHHKNGSWSSSGSNEGAAGQGQECHHQQGEEKSNFYDKYTNGVDDDECHRGNKIDEYEFKVNNSVHSLSKKSLVGIQYLISSLLNISDVITFGAGFCLILCVYVRPDSCLLVGLLALGHAYLARLPILLVSKSTWILLSGGAFALVVAVAEDISFYQDLVLSPWQWTKFNLLSEMSSKLFGTLGSSFYIRNVFFGHFVIGVLSLCFILSLCLTFKSLILATIDLCGEKMKLFHYSSESIKTCKDEKRKKTIIETTIDETKEKSSTISIPGDHLYTDHCHAITVAVITTIYSLHGHKEERFLHDVIVLYFIVISSIVTSLVASIASSLHNTLETINTKRLTISFLLLLFAFQEWNAMPTGKDSGVNECLYYISRQADVYGVFMDSQYADTFSYSILHKEVPLFTTMQEEYLEFHPRYFTSTNKPCLGYVPEKPNNCTIKYTGLNSVSNLVINTNTESVVKTVIDSPHYNYVIIRSSSNQTNFFHPAFRVVFQTKSATVWKRTYDPEHESQLESFSAQIPFGGRNTTLLEYEAEVLKQLGNYHVAASKFKVILTRPDGLKPGPMSSMAYCLYRMNMQREAKNLINVCQKRFDKDTCYSGFMSKIKQLGLV